MAYKAETFTTDDPRADENHIKVSTISKPYITRNLRWKRAKRRNSTSVTRRIPTTSSYATRNHTSSYLNHQRPIRWTTTPLIYIAKERRCLNLSMKEDRQPRNDFCCSLSQVTKQYGVYTTSPSPKTTSTIIEVRIDKSLQFQVNWLNISRDTSIKARPKKSSKTLNFHSFQTLTLI